MISAANTSGSGRCSKSARDLSLIQKISRLDLSRSKISRAENFRQRPSGFSSDCLAALMAVLWIKAADKVFQISVGHGELFQCEVDVGAEIVYPNLFCLPLRAGRAFVEENHIGLDARLVKNAGRQTQDRMQVSGLQQLPAHSFPGPALKEHVVRHHHRGLSGAVQNGVDVLDEVQLLSAFNHAIGHCSLAIPARNSDALGLWRVSTIKPSSTANPLKPGSA